MTPCAFVGNSLSGRFHAKSAEGSGICWAGTGIYRESNCGEWCHIYRYWMTAAREASCGKLNL